MWICQFNSTKLPLSSDVTTIHGRKYVSRIENPLNCSSFLFLFFRTYLNVSSFCYSDTNLLSVCKPFEISGAKEKQSALLGNINTSQWQLRVFTFCLMTHRGEDFCSLLNSGDLGPLPLLKELHPSGVVQRCRRVRAEEGGEPLAVGQSRRAGAIGQLGHKKAIMVNIDKPQIVRLCCCKSPLVQIWWHALQISGAVYKVACVWQSRGPLGLAGWRIGDYVHAGGVKLLLHVWLIPWGSSELQSQLVFKKQPLLSVKQEGIFKALCCLWICTHSNTRPLRWSSFQNEFWDWCVRLLLW